MIVSDSGTLVRVRVPGPDPLRITEDLREHEPNREAPGALLSARVDVLVGVNAALGGLDLEHPHEVPGEGFPNGAKKRAPLRFLTLDRPPFQLGTVREDHGSATEVMETRAIAAASSSGEGLVR